jgi:phage tail-like protein
MTEQSINNNDSFEELNYVTANRFYVEIGSEIKASFSECSGLGVTIDKEVYLEGGVNNQQRIFLKQAKFNDVTLKRGVTNDYSFWQWISQVLESTTTPKKRLNVSIMVFNQAGQRMQRWTLNGTIPVGWKTPSLQANSNTVAIEELTLTYESITVEGPETGAKQEVNIKGEERDSKGFFPSNNPGNIRRI